RVWKPYGLQWVDVCGGYGYCGVAIDAPRRTQAKDPGAVMVVTRASSGSPVRLVTTPTFWWQICSRNLQIACNIVSGRYVSSAMSEDHDRRAPPHSRGRGRPRNRRSARRAAHD